MWCQSANYLFPVHGNISVEMEHKHLETFKEIWLCCDIKACDFFSRNLFLLCFTKVFLRNYTKKLVFFSVDSLRSTYLYQQMWNNLILKSIINNYFLIWGKLYYSSSRICNSIIKSHFEGAFYQSNAPFIHRDV